MIDRADWSGGHAGGWETRQEDTDNTDVWMETVAAWSRLEETEKSEWKRSPQPLGSNAWWSEVELIQLIVIERNCTVNIMCLNYPKTTPPWSVEKLWRHAVTGATKFGYCWNRIHISKKERIVSTWWGRLWEVVAREDWGRGCERLGREWCHGQQMREVMHGWTSKLQPWNLQHFAWMCSNSNHH